MLLESGAEENVITIKKGPPMYRVCWEQYPVGVPLDILAANKFPGQSLLEVSPFHDF